MKNLLERAFKKILWETSLTVDIWRRSRQFKGDKDYDLNLVAKGFADNRKEIQDDSAILNRICVAYNKAKEAQSKALPVFSPSNEWLPIYEIPFKEVIGVLTKGDIKSLNRIYSNFWRDPCSTGLVGLAVNMKRCYMGKRISLRHRMLFLNDVLYRHKLWRSLMGNSHPVENLDSPFIGNPYGYYVNGKFFICGSDYLNYYANVIGKLINDNNLTKCVVELGAGFGGMAYYLLRSNKDVSYIDFDLPENSALTAYYLLKAFPERKIRLYGEVDSMQDSIRDNEILILPSFEINNLPAACAGVVYNSYSLAEMSRDTISNYMSEFTRIIGEGGYLLHVNHTKNSLVIADDFGLDPNKFDLQYKKPALWNMGRNSRMDEYEYLYKKRLNTI